MMPDQLSGYTDLLEMQMQPETRHSLQSLGVLESAWECLGVLCSNGPSGHTDLIQRITLTVMDDTSSTDLMGVEMQSEAWHSLQCLGPECCACAAGSRQVTMAQLRQNVA